MIASKHEEMLNLLYEVCVELHYHGLKANPRKLLVGLKKIKYLGYQLFSEGITPVLGRFVMECLY